MMATSQLVHPYLGHCMSLICNHIQHLCIIFHAAQVEVLLYILARFNFSVFYDCVDIQNTIAVSEADLLHPVFDMSVRFL